MQIYHTALSPIGFAPTNGSDFLNPTAHPHLEGQGPIYRFLCFTVLRCVEARSSKCHRLLCTRFFCLQTTICESQPFCSYYWLICMLLLGSTLRLIWWATSSFSNCRYVGLSVPLWSRLHEPSQMVLASHRRQNIIPNKPGTYTDA